MNRPAVIEVIGHSVNLGYGTVSPESAWPALVAAELGAFDANYANGGLVLGSNGNGFARYIRPAAALRNRTTGPYLSPVDVFVANVGIADLATNYVNNGVVTPSAFRNAFRATAAFACLGGYFGAEPGGASHASIAYGGTWADAPVTDRNVGAGVRVAQSSPVLTITVPADFPGGEIDLFWVVLPFSFGSGVDWSIAVTGATTMAVREIITPADASPVQGTVDNYKVTRLTNLNPGAHTITATGTVTGFGASFDGWGIRAPTPPELIVVKQPRMTGAVYESFLGPYPADTPTDATVALINRDLQALAVETGAHWLEFPELLLDPARYIGLDGAHPNEAACRQYADVMLDFLNSLPDSSSNAPLIGLPAAAGAGWGNDTAPYGALTVRRAPPRRITLQGRAKRTGTPTVGETVATIPEGLRPATSHAYAVPGSTGTPVVTVAADGTVKYTAGTLGASATIDLDGIEWNVGQ